MPLSRVRADGPRDPHRSTPNPCERSVARRHIAVIIPHLGLYGGNLRYVELGNALTDRGVDFTIATPNATRPDYLEYRGRTATIDELRADPPEILLASEQRILPDFLAFPAGRRVFYAIIEKTARDREIAELARRGEIELLANSTGIQHIIKIFNRIRTTSTQSEVRFIQNFQHCPTLKYSGGDNQISEISGGRRKV
jgi:hypothetical protein